MKPEQAQERLEEIRRLLFEREKKASEVLKIDQKIAELAGVSDGSIRKSSINRKEFRILCS